jgi:hypothetical protein
LRLIKVKRKSGCEYEGIEFSDGRVVIHWTKSTQDCPSVTVMDNFGQFKRVYLDSNPEKNASVEIREV